MKFNLSMDVKKKNENINLFVPKNTTRVDFFLLMLSFLFLFFCNFHMKQEILVDNKIENEKIIIKKKQVKNAKDI